MGFLKVQLCFPVAMLMIILTNEYLNVGVIARPAKVHGAEAAQIDEHDGQRHNKIVVPSWSLGSMHSPNTSLARAGPHNCSHGGAYSGGGGCHITGHPLSEP